VAEMVVAVDGPAGSGKSSVSRQAARELGFGYLDTGAGYRAFALHRSNNHEQTLEQLISGFDYLISCDPDNELVMLEGKDVTETIRTARVSALVSEVARIQDVRRLQFVDARERIAACPKPGIVVEGRDITTVVAPDAAIKVLLAQTGRLQTLLLQGQASLFWTRQK